MEKTVIVASGLSVLLALIAPCSAQTTTSASVRYEEIPTTSILLPSGLFSPAPVQQNFTGWVSTISSTTFYSVLPFYYANFTDFAPLFITRGYPFAASAAGTRYVLQNLTINCPSTTPVGTATCTTTFTNLDNTDPPTYHTLAESSFYKMVLCNRNTTEHIPRPTPTLLKVGIGLSAPLAVCMCLLLVLFICRHRQHKQLSRLQHTRVVAVAADGARDDAGGEETKLEPLVPPSEGGSTTGFAALRDGTGIGVVEGGDGAGRDYGIRAGGVPAYTNELDGVVQDGEEGICLGCWCLLR